MKLLILPDLHISEKQPENRCDDYSETTLRKLKFIYDTADELKVDLILQPGDFTDSFTMQWSFFIKIVDMINKYNIPLYTVHGQHSLRYRTKGNTVLDAIAGSCPSIRILEYNVDPIIKNMTAFFGSGYGERLHKVPDVNCTSVFIVHKMIVATKKLWSSQEDFTWAKDFLQNHKFELIVSGDNHAQFEVFYKGQFLFNCGTMMRNTIAFIDYEPHFIYFDTESHFHRKYDFPIEPPEKVFKMDKIKEEQERKESMGKIVEGLSLYKHVGLKFKENLFNHAKKSNASDDVIKLLEEGFEEASNGKSAK